MPQARLLFLTRDAIPKDLPLEGVELVSPDWNRQAIKDIYCQADLLALPSRLETWGDVLLEAMAYGIPCIGVWDQAMREIIEDEVTGLLVPPEDVTALTKAMIRILSDTQLRDRFGQTARQRVVQKYTWDHVVGRLTPAIRAAAELSLSQGKGKKPISA
jgi:glycosyltransferase involved in cell wall biosynthesis